MAPEQPPSTPTHEAAPSTTPGTTPGEVSPWDSRSEAIPDIPTGPTRFVPKKPPEPTPSEGAEPQAPNKVEPPKASTDDNSDAGASDEGAASGSGSAEGGTDAAPDVLSGTPISALTPSDIPTFINGFNKWFDALTPSQVEEMYKNPKLKEKIEDGLRGEGGFHEFLMVVEAPVWKKWRVTAAEVQGDFAIPISKLNGGIAKNWKHSTGQKGGELRGFVNFNSNGAHNELRELIKTSGSLSEYKDKMKAWADKWIMGGYENLPSGFHQEDWRNDNYQASSR